MQCPRCQHDNPADSAFCDECGARLEATCANGRQGEHKLFLLAAP